MSIFSGMKKALTDKIKQKTKDVTMDIIKVILTSLLSAAALFIMAKLVGHKQIAQLEFFDYINGITVGSIGAELATELEELWKPLTALIVYGAIAVLLGIITNKFPRARSFINGAPTVIIKSGKLYRSNLKRAKLDLSELLCLCREQGYFDLSDIECAIFEADGKLTVLPRSDARPVTPRDIGISPKYEGVATEVIMDGRIIEANIKSLGLDLTWLERALHAQNAPKVREIVLALYKDGELTVFKN